MGATGRSPGVDGQLLALAVTTPSRWSSLRPTADPLPRPSGSGRGQVHVRRRVAPGGRTGRPPPRRLVLGIGSESFLPGGILPPGVRCGIAGHCGDAEHATAAGVCRGPRRGPGPQTDGRWHMLTALSSPCSPGGCGARARPGVDPRTRRNRRHHSDNSSRASSIQTRSDDLEPDKRAPVPTTVSPLQSVETDRRAGHVRGPRGPSYRSEPVAATEY